MGVNQGGLELAAIFIVAALVCVGIVLVNYG